MGEVFQLPLSSPQVENRSLEPHTSDYGGGNGGGDDMLQRIKTLEDKVATMATDIAVIKSNYATSANVESVKTDIANAKADLHSAMRLQALAIIGSVLAAVGTGVGLIIKMMPALPH
ncbi:TPA: hypothetical protein QIU16_002688 [Citrobacter freundii]|nr:hypothetical protein [Citrobacter freundii]HEP1396025.1 hypothetical protein [Citrobacter freundii]